MWAQSSLPGCVCAKVMTSVVSVRRGCSQALPLRGSAAACAPAASASGAASKAGCRGALSLSGGGLEREGCTQAASDVRCQACLCPFQSDVLSHAWCQVPSCPCVKLCLLGREGSMLG